jgi:uncharacterized protein DUF1302
LSRLGVLALAAWCVAVSGAAAQSFDGYASVLFDVLPNARRDGTSTASVAELRSRLYGDYHFDAGRTRVTLAGSAEALARGIGRDEVVRDAILLPQDVNVEARWAHADLRVGLSRVVWGRLDEFQPTDVVNPQDLTRFFLEGRTEGRMPVGMLRGRWLPSDAVTLEAIYVPLFRRGRFDQLDEETSPFNVAPPVPAMRLEPARTLENAQGGVRASVTTGRVDWAISTYRGFEPLPIFLPASPTSPAPPALLATFPRFTMLGGDFETVKGQWGVRGEVAVFPDRTVQLPTALGVVKGRSVEGGVGVDRKTGGYRVSGTVMFTSRPDRDDVTLVSAVDRSFARETRSVRAFAVYNPREDSAFARVIASATVRDNVSLEGSFGWFAGNGFDVLSRFSDRDFLYARFKVFF